LCVMTQVRPLDQAQVLAAPRRCNSLEPDALLGAVLEQLSALKVRMSLTLNDARRMEIRVGHHFLDLSLVEIAQSNDSSAVLRQQFLHTMPSAEVMGAVVAAVPSVLVQR